MSLLRIFELEKSNVYSFSSLPLQLVAIFFVSMVIAAIFVSMVATCYSCLCFFSPLPMDQRYLSVLSRQLVLFNEQHFKWTNVVLDKTVTTQTMNNNSILIFDEEHYKKQKKKSHFCFVKMKVCKIEWSLLTCAHGYDVGSGLQVCNGSCCF